MPLVTEFPPQGYDQMSETEWIAASADYLHSLRDDRTHTHSREDAMAGLTLRIHGIRLIESVFGEQVTSAAVRMESEMQRSKE